MATAAQQKTVGAANGWQAALFKMNLIGLPLGMSGIIGLCTWMVTAIFETKEDVAVLTERVEAFISAGPRYTPTHAKADRLELKNEIMLEVERQYPPQWLRDMVESLRKRVDHLERERLKQNP